MKENKLLKYLKDFLITVAFLFIILYSLDLINLGFGINLPFLLESLIFIGIVIFLLNLENVKKIFLRTKPKKTLPKPKPYSKIFIYFQNITLASIILSLLIYLLEIIGISLFVNTNLFLVVSFGLLVPLFFLWLKEIDEDPAKTDRINCLLNIPVIKWAGIPLIFLIIGIGIAISGASYDLINFETIKTFDNIFDYLTFLLNNTVESFPKNIVFLTTGIIPLPLYLLKNSISKHIHLLPLVIFLILFFTDLISLLNNSWSVNIHWYTRIILFIFVSILIIIFPNKKINETHEASKLNKRIIYGLLLIITIWGSYFILNQLGKNDFFHDETFHVGVITSLRRGHGLRTWNFLTDQPTERIYSRGALTNYFGYFLSLIWGFNEVTLRFFPALITITTIPLVFIVIKKFFSSTISIITTIGYTFNLITLFLGRFLRPYPVFLLAYLLCFYLIELIAIRLESTLNRKKIRQIIILLSLFIIISFISVQAHQVGKLIWGIAVFNLTLTIIFHNNIKRILNKRANIAKILFSTPILFLLIYLLDKIPSLHLLGTFHQVRHYLSFEGGQLIYLSYLFDTFIRSNNLYFFSFIFGFFYTINLAIKEKRIKFFRYLVAVLPLILFVFFKDRYEDFRYIHFLVPFIIGLSIFGLSQFLNLICNINGENNRNFVLLLMSLFLFFMPVTNSHIPGITLKAPHAWEGSDGKQYLHRRAVAPEYKKAFNYINQNQKPGDSVIITDGQIYADINEEVSYFSMPNWSYADYIINPVSGNRINFLEFMENNEYNDIYFTGAYVYMLDPEVNDYLINNCVSIGKKINILFYNYGANIYSEEFSQKFTWPSLFLCKPQINTK